MAVATCSLSRRQRRNWCAFGARRSVRIGSLTARNPRVSRGFVERRLPESNRCKRLCRPLRSHSAKAPEEASLATRRAPLAGARRAADAIDRPAKAHSHALSRSRCYQPCTSSVRGHVADVHELIGHVRSPPDWWRCVRSPVGLTVPLGPPCRQASSRNSTWDLTYSSTAPSPYIAHVIRAPL
jgi:hypothetical protein